MADQAEQVSTIGLVDTKQQPGPTKRRQYSEALKRQMVLILLFFTMLLLFSLMWVALFLSKQVTVPIQALADGTREISSGNFDYAVPEQAHDELGVLARSFNNMTRQLRDNRSQIDQFTRNLQQAVQELERRRQLMETVLESIPTGVVSLDANGAILRANSAVTGILGSAARVGDNPAHGQRGAAILRNFDRHLIIGAAHAPRLHFEQRLGVLNSLLEGL